MSEFSSNNIAIDINDHDLPDFNFNVSEKDRYNELNGGYSQSPSQSQDENDNYAMTDVNVDDMLGIDLNVDKSKDDTARSGAKKTLGSRYLTENQLLSNYGLSFIKKTASKKLLRKMKHKEEYKNLENFLVYYQTWGHKLFPRANFEDFLKMTSNLGIVSKRVRLQREQWIEEEMSLKNKDDDFMFTNDIWNNADDNNADEEENKANDDNDEENRNNDEDAGITIHKKKTNPLFFDDEDDDELYETRTVKDPDLLPIEETTEPLEKPLDFTNLPPTDTAKTDEVIPEEEDFPPPDEFDDEYEAEMEAMREME